ncbi:response regulator [Dyella flagellata]|uniref:Response regulatory domain-containing protein n=1 Tax=Dyella flagellata TaxID=1867833 RepID=A0ABQ5XE18_9GAMM|nr:response regulator [Dyella flagellata]GLQ89752.1 hypothetical protein GCM10007898_33270 [Dyella flagellata]
MPSNESTTQQLRDNLKMFSALAGEAKPDRPEEVLRALRCEVNALAQDIDRCLGALADTAAREKVCLPAPSVLVVDDLSSARLVMATTLARIGFNVEQAASGAEALNKLAHKQFDACLVDMHLGVQAELDGIQLLEAMTETLRGAEASTVLLAMSIDNAPALMEQARIKGATDWIHKPIETTKLIQQVCSALWKEPQASGNGASGVVDPLAYSALRALGTPERRRDIIVHAMADAMASLQEIRRSIGELDATGWNESMTALHGVAAQIGARSLTQDIESALREGLGHDVEHALAIAERLESGLARVQVELQSAQAL